MKDWLIDDWLFVVKEKTGQVGELSFSSFFPRKFILVVATHSAILCSMLLFREHFLLIST